MSDIFKSKNNIFGVSITHSFTISRQVVGLLLEPVRFQACQRCRGNVSIPLQVTVNSLLPKVFNYIRPFIFLDRNLFLLDTVCIYNQIICSSGHFNCSNIHGGRNLQKQVKKGSVSKIVDQPRAIKFFTQSLEHFFVIVSSLKQLMILKSPFEIN